MRCAPSCYSRGAVHTGMRCVARLPWLQNHITPLAAASYTVFYTTSISLFGVHWYCCVIEPRTAGARLMLELMLELMRVERSHAMEGPIVHDLPIGFLISTTYQASPIRSPAQSTPGLPRCPSLPQQVPRAVGFEHSPRPRLAAPRSRSRLPPPPHSPAGSTAS